MSSFFNVSIACATSCISCSLSLSLSRSNSASSTYISIFPDPFCKWIPPMKRKIVGTCDTPAAQPIPAPRNKGFATRPVISGSTTSKPPLRWFWEGPSGPLVIQTQKISRDCHPKRRKGWDDHFDNEDNSSPRK